jgi:hypothetical protein
MARARSDIANMAIRIFLQDMGRAYHEDPTTAASTSPRWATTASEPPVPRERPGWARGSARRARRPALVVARHAEAAHGERPASKAERLAAGVEPHREEQQRRPERRTHGTHGERGSTVRAERLRGAGGAEAERG